MALSSSSTYAEAIGQLNDNLSYEGSASKTNAYLEAARWLLFNRGNSSADSATSLSFESLESSITKAEAHRRALNRTTRSPFTRARSRS